MKIKIKIALSLIVFMSILQQNIISAEITKFDSLPNVTKQGTVYVINYPVDLDKEVVQIAPKSTIHFTEGGYIYNGTLIGDDTKIKADRENQIFTEDLIIQGSWNNTHVYSEWVGLNENGTANDQQFANLMALCNGQKLTHLYIQEGDFFVSAHKESAPIIIPSNVYWHNKARIHMLPTNLKKYNIVLILKVNNVTIDGGEFIGDVIDHSGTEGEWGHGIKCAGATNVTLKNLRCSYCWGDGIDLIEGWTEENKPTITCDYITIKNVKCLHNRRQGMSIEAAHHVKVINSEFAYTGTPFMTKPTAGVDIEEWNAEGHKMNHVLFKDCSFHDNAGYDVQCEPNWKMGRDGYREYENDVHFEGCVIGKSRINFTNGISFKNSTLEDIKVEYCNNIFFYKCSISDLKHSRNDSTVKIKKCKLGISNS